MPPPEVVFAHPSARYPSYEDYRTLVRVSGFETVPVDAIDTEREAVTVVCPVNREFLERVERDRARWKARRGRIVFWNFENPDCGPGEASELEGQMVANSPKELLASGAIDAVWTSDMSFCAREKHIFVPLASDLRLCPVDPLPAEKRDGGLVMVGYENPRRQEIMGRIRAANHSLIGAVPQSMRPAVLSRATAVLNLHQADGQGVEVMRLAMAAAYGLPVISETIPEPHPLERGIHYMEASTEDLPGALGRLLSPHMSSTLRRMGQLLRRVLCFDTCFASQVRAGAWETLNR